MVNRSRYCSVRNKSALEGSGASSTRSPRSASSATLALSAPDSIQFILDHFDADEDVQALRRFAGKKGVQVEILGLSDDNARAFWNWRFFRPPEDLSPTREVLKRICDPRLPVRPETEQPDFIATALDEAAERAVPQP